MQNKIGYTMKEFLQNNIPEISIETIQVKSGDEHTIFEVNDTWIFRCAKSTDIQKHMAVEVKLLKELENKLTVAIPTIAYYFPEKYCFGYKKIEGMPLSSTLYAGFGRAQKNKFADDLAQFLWQLQSSIPLKQAQEIGLTHADWPLKPDELKKRLYFIADTSLKEIFTDFINEYEQLGVNQSRIVVIHNDLHTNNILIDPKTKRLSGIIDFTSAAIDTVYHEFRYLHLIDMNLVALAVNAYAQKSGQTLKSRDAYIYCMATEFSRLAESLERNESAKSYEITQRIQQLQNMLQKL